MQNTILKWISSTCDWTRYWDLFKTSNKIQILKTDDSYIQFFMITSLCKAPCFLKLVYFQNLCSTISSYFNQQMASQLLNIKKIFVKYLTLAFWHYIWLTWCFNLKQNKKDCSLFRTLCYWTSILLRKIQ